MVSLLTLLHVQFRICQVLSCKHVDKSSVCEMFYYKIRSLFQCKFYTYVHVLVQAPVTFFQLIFVKLSMFETILYLTILSFLQSVTPTWPTSAVRALLKVQT
jgi:hypothetical protein